VHPGKRFDNNYSLNTVDICPVGALTSKDFRFKMRVWFLKETKSISTWDGSGCNVLVGAREGKIHRITPRENGEVNSLWMPDAARFEFHEFERADRFTTPMVRVGGKQVASDWHVALVQVAEKLKTFAPGEVAILASARLTNEELWLTSEIAKTLKVSMVDVKPRPQQGDGFLISNDGNPNTAGARLLGVSRGGESLKEIAASIESGKIKALFSLTEDAVECGLPVEKLSYYVHLGALPNMSTMWADVILPGAGFGEKRGSMINVQGRLQRLGKAISCPGEAREELDILLELKTALGGGNGLHSAEDVFKALAASQPALQGLTFSRITDLGVLLNLAS
jgi:NADH-quinone oxidoreductase subunit G